MSRTNRKTKSAKKKPARRRSRRKKQSKLFAAVVIELIAAVALFNTIRFARDVRESQPSIPNPQALAEPSQQPRVQTSAPWDRLVSAISPAEPSIQAPKFRPSRLIGFMQEGS